MHQKVWSRTQATRLHLLAISGVLLAGLFGSPAIAQSEAGLAQRQTIPYVVRNTDPNDTRSTDIEIHNPHQHALRIEVTYFGATASTRPGRLACDALDVDGLNTRTVPIESICALGQGFNWGRLEVQGAVSGAVIVPATGLPRPSDPSDGTFLASGLIRWTVGSRVMRVEGFPQGGLSGARSLATGLRSGTIDGESWTSLCYAAALGEAVPIRIRLLDSKGGELGSALDTLDPSANMEMASLNVFSALGVAGDHSGVSAEFTTISGSGQAALGFCRLINLTRQTEALIIGKFVDGRLDNANRDQGRQHSVSVSEDRLGWPYGLRIGAGLQDHQSVNFPSNYHVAYFQHPDSIHCTLSGALRGSYVGSVFPPYLQMRLIDPDDNTVATSLYDSTAGETVLDFQTGEKSSAGRGNNQRWLIEVAPIHALQSPSCGAGLCSGGAAPSAEYTLSCASGNGHGQLDKIHESHCGVTCRQNKGWNCEFNPVDRPENGFCPAEF